MVDEVNPWFNSEAHPLLQNPGCSQALQPSLTAPLNSLHTHTHTHRGTASTHTRGGTGCVCVCVCVCACVCACVCVCVTDLGVAPHIMNINPHEVTKAMRHEDGS